MKKRPIDSIFALCLVIGSTFSNLSGQNENGRFQGFLVWEDVVFPSAAEAYEKATRMQMELYANRNFPHGVKVYSTSENIYYWIYEIDSYADIDTLYTEFGNLYENDREQVEAIITAFGGTHESTKTWTYYWDRNLSYNPGVAEVPDEENLFTFWEFNYVTKGKMEEMKGVFREWVELSSEKKATQSWNTYIVDLGMETPCLFWISTASSAADFYSTNASDMDMLGEAAWELVNKQRNLTRKIVDQTGTFRKELSYSPGEYPVQK